MMPDVRKALAFKRFTQKRKAKQAYLAQSHFPKETTFGRQKTKFFGCIPRDKK